MKLIHAEQISGRERYQLLTSLVVPRPIAWVSTRGTDGAPNLAPFSYFAAISATPLLITVSIGSRAGVPKDTLRNILDTGVFCINIVTEAQLTEMNQTSGEYGPEVNEFEHAGLRAEEAETVAAPYVGDCPAVFECRLFKHVPLDGSSNTLVIGEVLLVRIADAELLRPDSYIADAERLRPVGRLWGDLYALLGETPALARPRV